MPFWARALWSVPWTTPMWFHAISRRRSSPWRALQKSQRNMASRAAAMTGRRSCFMVPPMSLWDGLCAIRTRPLKSLTFAIWMLWPKLWPPLHAAGKKQERRPCSVPLTFWNERAIFTLRPAPPILASAPSADGQPIPPAAPPRGRHRTQRNRECPGSGISPQAQDSALYPLSAPLPCPPSLPLSAQLPAQPCGRGHTTPPRNPPARARAHSALPHQTVLHLLPWARPMAIDCFCTRRSGRYLPDAPPEPDSYVHSSCMSESVAY